MSAKRWPSSTRIGQCWPDVGQVFPDSAKIIDQVGRGWPNNGQTWPNIREEVAHIGKTSAKLGLGSLPRATFRKLLENFGAHQNRPGQLCQAHGGQRFGNVWVRDDGARPRFVEMRGREPPPASQWCEPWLCPSSRDALIHAVCAFGECRSLASRPAGRRRVGRSTDRSGRVGQALGPSVIGGADH